MSSPSLLGRKASSFRTPSRCYSCRKSPPGRLRRLAFLYPLYTDDHPNPILYHPSICTGVESPNYRPLSKGPYSSPNYYRPKTGQYGTRGAVIRSPQPTRRGDFLGKSRRLRHMSFETCALDPTMLFCRASKWQRRPPKPLLHSWPRGGALVVVAFVDCGPSREHGYYCCQASPSREATVSLPRAPAAEDKDDEAEWASKEEYVGRLCQAC